MSFVNPIILPFLIQYVNDFNYPTYSGFIYIFCIIIAQLAGSVFYYYGSFRANIAGMNMRTALLLLVYRKSLEIAPSKDSNSGQIVNMVSSDALFIADSVSIVAAGVSVPLQLIISFVLLGIYVNYFVVILLGIMFLSLPLMGKLGMAIGNSRFKLQQSGDKRLKMINELLQGIRIVKYYAWEEAFFNNIDKARERELSGLRSMGFIRAGLINILQATITVSMGLTIIIYALYADLNQSILFTLMSLFALIRQAFIMLPLAASLIPQYMASFRRVQIFMENPNIVPVEQSKSSDPQIDVENAAFQWSGSNEPFLKNVNLKSKKGDLIMIVGPVGSGKSAVIQALLGEIPKVSGSLSVAGTQAYVSQEAFIVNTTVRENIIFGKPFDMKKYRDVLEAAALMPDLHQFTAGDSTEIGERGVNLSGGQKQVSQHVTFLSLLLKQIHFH
jgi:ABC-type multidrug transport system fused ATPase/permease subunit